MVGNIQHVSWNVVCSAVAATELCHVLDLFGLGISQNHIPCHQLATKSHLIKQQNDAQMHTFCLTHTLETPKACLKTRVWKALIAVMFPVPTQKDVVSDMQGVSPLSREAHVA